MVEYQASNNKQFSWKSLNLYTMAHALIMSYQTMNLCWASKSRCMEWFSWLVWAIRSKIQIFHTNFINSDSKQFQEENYHKSLCQSVVHGKWNQSMEYCSKQLWNDTWSQGRGLNDPSYVNKLKFSHESQVMDSQSNCNAIFCWGTMSTISLNMSTMQDDITWVSDIMELMFSCNYDTNRGVKKFYAAHAIHLARGYWFSATVKDMTHQDDDSSIKSISKFTLTNDLFPSIGSNENYGWIYYLFSNLGHMRQYNYQIKWSSIKVISTDEWDPQIGMYFYEEIFNTKIGLLLLRANYSKPGSKLFKTRQQIIQNQTLERSCKFNAYLWVATTGITSDHLCEHKMIFKGNHGLRIDGPV